MSTPIKVTARIVVVTIVLAAWLSLFHDDAHAAAPAKDYTKGCHIPWAVANGGYNINDWCKKHRSKPRLDPVESYLLKCGGGAVIATWFTRRGKLPVALGALAACSWDGLFKGHPEAHGKIKRHVYYRVHVPAGGRTRHANARA